MFNVSVVIPAFNEATRINRSIQSVLNQSLPVKEIIVVDDGSTDETAHVVANYYPAVTCIRQENQGLAGARNTGIKQARYEWIALLDADDEWTPNHIENAASILRQHEGIEWFFAAFDVRNPDGGLFHGSRLKEKYLRGDLVKDYFNAQAETGFSCSSSVLVKAEIFTQIGMFNMEIKHYGEDLDMWFRIA